MGLPYGFKAAANRIAIGLRRQMGLPREAPLNLYELAARLGLRVVPISTFADVCPEHIVQLLTSDPRAFSASLIQLQHGRIILVNDGHSFRRINSDIAHEVAHALLAHPPTQLFNHSGCRNFDKDTEEQADCLSSHILIPNEAASHIVWSGCSKDTACERYGVSRQMLEYRLNTSGARIRRDRLRKHR